MSKRKQSSLLVAGLFLMTAVPALSALPSYAEELAQPVRVSDYRLDESLSSLESSLPRDAAGEELVDPTVEDIQRERRENSSSNVSTRPVTEWRMAPNFDFASAAGKIIIRVHKSNDKNVPEYLEVYRQSSVDPTDLVPQNIFDNETSNRALVSTAGVYGGKQFVTPNGIYGIDSMEEMHYSKTYNNAPMPWTLFFNQGIAIHAATPSEFKFLGRKASHGCVRVHETNAKLLFDFVKNSGAKPRGNVVIVIQEG